MQLGLPFSAAPRHGAAAATSTVFEGQPASPPLVAVVSGDGAMPIGAGTGTAFEIAIESGARAAAGEAIAIPEVTTECDGVIAGVRPVPVASPGAALDFYYVRHSRARRYLVRVDIDGRVRVTIPRGGSKREADAFASRHLDWIERQRSRLQRSSLTVAERLLLRARAERELPPLLLAEAERHGLQVARISIRNQRSRWGSCGRDGHITLNWRLLLMPEWVRDYVLVHELMHLRRLDHSPAFWAHVAAVFPRVEEARTWLRVNGGALA